MRVLSLAPLAGPGVDALRALGDLEVDAWIDHIPIKLHAPDELIARTRGVDALIVEADFVPAEVLDAGELRLLGVCRGDPNNVDLDAATRNGVAVVRTPGRNAAAVAELAVGLMLGLLRGIVGADADVRSGRWVVDGRIAQQRYRGRELSSCVVGLVGCGAVGGAVARILSGFGATVIGFDPVVPPDRIRAAGIEPIASMPELLGAAEIVSLHAPLTPATMGMIGAAEFAAMKPGALLINTARSGLTDESALLDALASGRLAGAGIDHFTNEFLPEDHPLVSIPNVILTPHIGGSTTETVERHTARLAAGFAAVLAGRAHDTVANPDVLAAR